ncbi:sulfite exporter TauE/SafE family protein [Glaciecola sp.]|jgi:uncharacterized membrane protein YfcA|nr:sulfite exporter TauE/SafE family protein [Glaciecola sp.]
MFESMTSVFVDLSFITVMMLIAISVVGGFLRGLAGFGSAMLMAGPMALLIDPIIAVAIIVILEAGISLPLMKTAKSFVNWQLTRRLLVGAVLAAPVGVFTLQLLSAESSSQLISIVAIIAAILLLVGYQRKSATTRGKEMIVGGASGFSCGIAGIAGPPVVLYLLSGAHDHKEMRATLIYYFALIDIYVLMVLLLLGDVIFSPLIIALGCFPFMWFGAYWGSRCLANTNPKQYKLFALWMILVGNIVSLVAVFVG